MYCSICYYTIESTEKHFKCMNNEKSCNSITCQDCLKAYINHIHDEKLSLVKCPDNNCKYEILYSAIVSSEDRDMVKKYEQICFSRLEKEYKNEAVIDINRKKIIEKIRNERHEFMNKTFPKSILYVINNSFSSKLNKIKRDNFKHIDELKKKKNPKCPNIYCLNGILDDSNNCIVCFDSFCKKCDQKLKDGHECDENELKTKEMLQKIIKCPNCSTTIFRSEGCNHMTCAVCKTMFLYTTGEKSNSGSHNKEVHLRELRKQSVEFEKDGLYDIETLDVLRLIEEKSPDSSTGRTVLLTLMKDYINLIENDEIVEKDRLKEKYYKKMAQKYQEYLEKKYRRAKHYNMVAEIQKLHDDKKLTKTILETINNSLSL